ncbi:MAG TPA: MFS transporter [Hyphomicrobiaceae bacterium]|nr:MFS transporter [Hyphomicrobiaceae bacterium]
MPILFILACAAFVSAFSMRMIDPLVPAIARDFHIEVETAALLASAFTFPYALSQPVLGPLGDAIGKARVIKVCLAMLGLMLAAAAYASSFEYLFAARILAGIAGGGIIPLAFAIIGDRFDMSDRQVALSRLVMASQISILMGSIAGGIVAAEYSWRWMFLVPSFAVFIVVVIAMVGLKSDPAAVRTAPSFARTRAAYADALASPYAAICLVGVFVGGSIMFGLMPFVTGRLERLGLGGLREGGIVIAAWSVGGIAFTIVVKILLARLKRAGLVRLGGIVLPLALAAYAAAGSWQLQAMIFVLVGLGFFMFHNCMQALGTELAPNARGASISLMAFVFFLGQATGPVVYAYAFKAFGPTVPILAAALVFAALGQWASRRLAYLDGQAASAPRGDDRS